MSDELEAARRYEIISMDGAAEASAQELAEEYPGSRFAIRNAAGQTVAEVHAGD